jgi:hypothetical protein
VSDFVCTQIGFQTVQRPGELSLVGEILGARKEAAGAIDLPIVEAIAGLVGFRVGDGADFRIEGVDKQKPVRVAATSPASRRRPIELVTSGIFQSVLLPDSGAKRCTRLPSTSTQ